MTASTRESSAVPVSAIGQMRKALSLRDAGYNTEETAALCGLPASVVRCIWLHDDLAYSSEGDQ